MAIDVSFLVKRWRLRAAEVDNDLNSAEKVDDDIVVAELKMQRSIYLHCAEQLEHELSTLDETECETCQGEGSPMGCGECGA